MGDALATTNDYTKVILQVDMFWNGSSNCKVNLL